jgi:hypothetical protein
MTFEQRVRALEPLGFTPRQTRFLVTVALHGGYCLRRHYQAFANIKYGKSVREFFEQLVTRGLARQIVYRRDRGYLYHLHAWSVYRSLQQDDNRNRRKTGPALIARKLMLLDYVLSIRDAEWFATEQDKVTLFTNGFQVPVACLPRRVYQSSAHGEQTTRYFVHKLPIALMNENHTVRFVHLVSDVSGQALAQFLADHALLFDRLPAWSVAAVCPGHLRGLDACEAIFQQFVSGRHFASSDGPMELSWYFSTRRKVEREEFGRLSIEDISRFREARQRFAGTDVEALYERWMRDGDVVLKGEPNAEPLRRTGLPPQIVMQWLPGKYEQFGSLPGVC